MPKVYFDETVAAGYDQGDYGATGYEEYGYDPNDPYGYGAGYESYDPNDPYARPFTSSR